MPVMRARSALVADARTASPNARVAEQPPQPDRDDRHDDEHEQLARASTVDVEARMPLAARTAAGTASASEPVR